MYNDTIFSHELNLYTERTKFLPLREGFLEFYKILEINV